MLYEFYRNLLFLRVSPVARTPAQRPCGTMTESHTSFLPRPPPTPAPLPTPQWPQSLCWCTDRSLAPTHRCSVKTNQDTTRTLTMIFTVSPRPLTGLLAPSTAMPPCPGLSIKHSQCPGTALRQTIEQAGWGQSQAFLNPCMLVLIQMSTQGLQELPASLWHTSLPAPTGLPRSTCPPILLGLQDSA